MPDTNEVLSVVREWVTKAEGDLKTAAYVLEMGEGCPTDTVCFHVQQCVEKYLKAFLVLKDIDFPKTHNVKDIVALLPTGIRLGLSIEEQDRLTDYATVTRYPGDYEPIPVSEARKAVSLARRVRRAMRGLFPKEALRRRKR